MMESDIVTEEKYEFDIYMQQLVVGAMLKDIYFLKQSMGLIKPSYFEYDGHSIICNIINNFFDKYKIIPNKEYIVNEIKLNVTDMSRQVVYLGELEACINSYEPGIDSREYLLDQLTEFARVQTLRKALSQTLDLLTQKINNKWDKIYSILNHALQVDKTSCGDLDYFNTVEERFQRMLESKEKGEVFTSGFETIDRALSDGGLSRGEIASWMGQSGTGKSIALVKAAVQNILRGKKVLYVSLEMDVDKIAQRVDAQFSLVPINEIFNQKDIIIETLKDHVEQYDDKRRFIIKQFPAGTLDIKGLRAYLSQIVLDGFKPDLLIVDYVGEMRIPSDIPSHESLYYIVRDLRGLAVEEQMCVFTAFQPRREGRDTQESGGVLDDNMIGSSYAMVRPLDALWSLNQSKVEKKAGVGKIYIAKHRSGRSRDMFPYRQTDNLDLIEIKHETYAARMSSVTEKTYVDNKSFKPNSGE